MKSAHVDLLSGFVEISFRIRITASDVTGRWTNFRIGCNWKNPGEATGDGRILNV